MRERLGEVATSESSPAAAWATSRQRLWRVVVAGLAVLGLLVATSFVAPTLVERAAVFLELRAVPADKRLAVLPFRAIGGDDADRALAEGLADLLTVRLAQLERFQETLWVEPASNIRQAGVRSASGAGRALGVTLAISGTVQRTDDHLLLTAILEDAQRSRTLRAATARSAEGLAQAVVRMLELELGPEARAALRATGTGVAEAAALSAQAIAYTPYAMGRTALERYEESQALEHAIGLFNQALERDPRYALAHAGLGEAYWRLYQNEKRAELAILAEGHCKRALDLDDLLAPAWITLGMVRLGTGRAEEALEDFQRALDRDPRSPAAHRERGYALERLGRFEEAEATYRRATELRPDYWSNYSYLGAFLASRGRAAEAEAAFRQALERAPDNARAWRNLGAALYYQGRTTDAEAAWLRSMELRPSAAGASNLAALQFYEGRYSEAAETLRAATHDGTRDYRIWRNLGSALYWAPGRREEATAAYGRAVELAEEQRAIDPSDAHLLIELADSLAMLGEREKARSTAREALDMGPVDGHVAVTAAGLYEHLGDRESALRWVEAALRAGHPPDEIDADPGLDGVRSDPRYLDLTTRMSPPDRPHLEP